MISDKSKIRKGMNITVVKCNYMNDRSYQGNVLKVVSIQRPFMVVEKKSVNQFLKNEKTGKMGMVTSDYRTTLKLDEWEFMQLTRRYVRAALSQN